MFPKTKIRRNHNRNLLSAMEAFEIADPELIEGTCGNIASLVNPTFDKNPKTGNWESVGGLFKGKHFYDKVSAPFLLAKLVASFPGLKVSCEGQDGYKVTWTVVLKHKATGAIFTFYDWKGAASIGSNLMPSDVKGQLKADFLLLIKALADPRFPHPYDGCVIGEVA